MTYVIACDQQLMNDGHYHMIHLYKSCHILTNQNSSLECMTLHTLTTTGTVLSPDRIMMDSSAQSFCQYGHRDGTGTLVWCDSVERILFSINMTCRNSDLWYTTNQVLMPPDDSIVTINQVCTPVPATVPTCPT